MNVQIIFGDIQFIWGIAYVSSIQSTINVNVSDAEKIADDLISDNVYEGYVIPETYEGVVVIGKYPDALEKIKEIV